MWIYKKSLMYPVKVDSVNPTLAKMLLTAYGGADGELSAALRYMNQRYCMPIVNIQALLTDIATEELAHLEMIATLAYKLSKDATLEQWMDQGLTGTFVEHGQMIYYTDSTGVPWNAGYVQVKNDPIADLTDDMAAEQKARASYNHLLDLTDDPGVMDALRFLREREIVHFQRFGEALVQAQEYFACTNVF